MKMKLHSDQIGAVSSPPSSAELKSAETEGSIHTRLNRDFLRRRIKKVAIIGLGYIGLPTFAAISKTKLFEVVGFDTDSKKIKLIKRGNSPIEDEEVKNYIKIKHLRVSDDKNILKDTDIFIICVPTPIYNDYTPNYSFIESATKTISPFIKRGSHVVLESTVNPGTCKEIVVPILSENTKLKIGKDFNLAHCPERINPGDNKWNINNINRNIGSVNKKLNKEIASFYRKFITDAVINEVDSIEIAEATKIIENTFRDVNIALVNELAKSFDAMGVDLYETLKASSNKPFGFMPHWPGCGVGGHCIGIDPYYLIKRAEKDGFSHNFLKLAREINKSMPEYTIHKFISGLHKLGLPVKGTRTTLLGLSYKAEVGDIRESPGIEIKKLLEELGANLKTYDPYVKSDFISLKEAIRNSVGIIIATDHREFTENLPLILSKTKVKIIIDGRNCLDIKRIKKSILYYGIGRHN